MGKRLVKILVPMIGVIVAALVMQVVLEPVFIHYHWRTRDVSSEREMRLLGKLFRKAEISGTGDWGAELLSEYEAARDPAERDSNRILEDYYFFHGGFVDTNVPVILPKKGGRGNFVIFSTGTVAWCKKRDLDEFLSEVSASFDERTP